MCHYLRRVLTLVSFFVACFLPRPAWTTVMTFDALPADFSEITTYTEDGITFEAVDGAPDHFHPDDNFDNGTTGAVLFSGDGNPFRISFMGGALFNLISLYVFDIDTGSGPIVFTTSGGATQNVDAPGPVQFGSSFLQVSFVDVSIPGGADDRFIGIDDISTVPEPGTLVFALLGVATLLGARRYTQNQGQA
jgi:hypothetical protein